MTLIRKARRAATMFGARRKSPKPCRRKHWSSFAGSMMFPMRATGKVKTFSIGSSRKTFSPSNWSKPWPSAAVGSWKRGAAAYRPGLTTRVSWTGTGSPSPASLRLGFSLRTQLGSRPPAGLLRRCWRIIGMTTVFTMPAAVAKSVAARPRKTMPMSSLPPSIFTPPLQTTHI